MEKDMHLPKAILVLGIVLLLIAVICLVLCFKESIGFLIGVLIFGVFGFFAVLCWKNQSAEMISQSEFVYTTMFGNKKTYRFSDIIDLKQNSDSMTLILKNGKVHIEACAIVSERFYNRIFDVLYPEDENEEGLEE